MSQIQREKHPLPRHPEEEETVHGRRAVMAALQPMRGASVAQQRPQARRPAPGAPWHVQPCPRHRQSALQQLGSENSVVFGNRNSVIESW